MNGALDLIVALCTPSGSVLAPLALALAGAAGSTMHCVPMCGGFVLGQVADRMAALPAAHLCEWRRLSAGALLPYHLGRLTTYSAFGALAGLGGGMLARLPWFGFVTGALLMLAAALFLLHALRRLWPVALRALPGLEHAPPGWSQVVARLTRGLDRGRPGGGYALGLALGLLPCGFLYAALAAAAASGGPGRGALAMAAFGIGTVPALVVVGIAGQAAGRYWQHNLAAFAPAILLLNATLLAVLAVRGMIAAV